MDISGAYNDSTSIRFKVRLAEDYGILILKIIGNGSESPCIIQLMTEKDVLIEEKTIAGTGIIRFEHILPGNFKLKAIHDTNGNGKWDTGDYSEGVLPENVEYYKAPLSIRANWDMQEEWQLEK